MFKQTLLRISFTVVAACLVGGCNDKGQAAANGATSANPGTSAPTDKIETKSLTVDEFLAKLTPTGCKALAQCKNDKFKATLETALITVSAFGAQDDPASQQQWDGILQARKKERAALATEQQCQALGGIAMKGAGLTAEALKPQIGKTVKYDAEKAGACIAALESPFPACATEVKLPTEPTRSEIGNYSKEFHDEIDAHTKACDEVLVGAIAAGQPCAHSYECSGAHSKCDKNVCAERDGKGGGARAAKRPAKR